MTVVQLFTSECHPIDVLIIKMRAEETLLNPNGRNS